MLSSLGTILAARLLVAPVAANAMPITLSFAFDNISGNVNGTVTGRILGLAGNALDQAASSVLIDSVPAGLGAHWYSPRFCRGPTFSRTVSTSQTVSSASRE